MPLLVSRSLRRRGCEDRGMLFSFLYLAVRALFGLLIRCAAATARSAFSPPTQLNHHHGCPAAKSTAATASAAYSTSTTEPPHEVRHE